MTQLRMRGRCIDWPIDSLHQWVAEGKTHAQIGEMLGLNPKLVSKACKRFGVQSQRRGPRSGPGHPEWKGGVRYDKNGYREVWVPKDDPFACMARARQQGRGKGYGYVPEHRLVMARHLGRPLESCEVVHHKNGVHDDNRIENLELFSNNGEHLAHELKGRCPRWTEDGRRRIAEAVRASNAKRRRLKRDGPQNSQNTHHSQDGPDKSEGNP